MKYVHLKSFLPHRMRATRRARNAYDNPRRHWWIGLLVFATMVLVGSAVLARAYFIHESFDTLAGVEATSTPMYQGALIEDVLDIYEARSSNYEAIISGGAARAPVVAISTATSTDDTTMATSSDERAAESEDIVE